eukprot:scaffold226509_cov18-Tisochrysis_lutea.AAC.1
MASANFCNLLGHASYQDLCTRIEHNQNGLESKTCAGVIQVSNVRTLCGKKARQNQQVLEATPPCQAEFSNALRLSGMGGGKVCWDYVSGLTLASKLTANSWQYMAQDTKKLTL